MAKFLAQWRNGRELVFRSLTWAEYRTFAAELTYRPEMSVYCDIYRAVVLQGPPLGSLSTPQQTDAPAGLVEFVGETLINESPYNGQYTAITAALETKRAQLRGNWLLATRAVIGALFQKSDAEMDTWDAETFFDYVARAEFVSGRPLSPGDPNPKKPVRKAGQQPQQPTAEGMHTFTRDAAPAQTPPDSAPEPDPAPRLRRPLTPAQQITLDRVRQTRG